eukprot:5600172-Pyramimonas_sp.AAC.1
MSAKLFVFYEFSLKDVVGVLYSTRAVGELQSWYAQKSIWNHQARPSVASRALNCVFYSS